MNTKIKPANGEASDQPPQTMREMLERTRLSKLPPVERRNSLAPGTLSQPRPATAVPCVGGCGSRLNLSDQIIQGISACRVCLSVYANLEVAFDEKAVRDKKERLEKFAAEVRQ